MVLFGALALAVPGQAQEIRADVDGERVNFPDAQPVNLNGHVMVPVRGVFERMNARVQWDEGSKTVTAIHGSDHIRLPIDSYDVTVNEKPVKMDTPATRIHGRTMVPIRFICEALGATVEWMADSNTVDIRTAERLAVPPSASGYKSVYLDEGTVIPFSLTKAVSSKGSAVGDEFTALLDAGKGTNYKGMDKGAVLEGHIEFVRPKTDTAPGVLGLAFDRIKMADDQTYDLTGVLIGLDPKSVESKDARLTARDDQRDDNLKYVGYGAGSGTLAAVLTQSGQVTDAMVGTALRALVGTDGARATMYRDVNLQYGTKFGVRLKQVFNFQVLTSSGGDHSPR